MKETIVYLPEPCENENGHDVYAADAVHAALDAAGVKRVQEDPKDYQVRMMKLQIEELKCVCTQLQAQLKEAQAENGSLAGLLADTQKHVDELYTAKEELTQAYLELQDQNAALKMTAKRAQEELKSVALTNGWREV